MQKNFVFFNVIIQDPSAHLFRIQCTLTSPDTAGQKFSLPSWIPGSYLMREFAKNIIAIQAYSKSKPILLKKIDKDTWQCEPCEDTLTIEYDIYAWDLSLRAAYLDSHGGFFNGTSLFLRPHALEDYSYQVQIEPPQALLANPCRLHTAMSATQIDENGFGRYQADNYDELVDHPVLFGNLEESAFYAGDTQHRLIVIGKHRGDIRRLTKDLTQLCEQQIQFFDTPAPFVNYTFLLRLEDDGYGGLEHRASSALICKPSSLPLPHEEEITENYRTLLGLFSHEYFHAWNIKQLKPKSFTPYDFNKENYTDLLWFFEGFTAYYDDLFLLRAKLITPESYLQLLGKIISTLLQTPGRLKQAVADASFDAWIKFYRPDENSANAGVSYYIKGSVVALALDFTIRQATHHQKSLDDVMRTLWKQYQQGNTEGLDESDIIKAAEDVAGTNLSAFFASLVHGTEDLPWKNLFAPFGIACELREQETAQSKKSAVYIGAKIKHEEHSSALSLSYLTTNGPAQKAGLCAGDTLVAFDNLRVSSANFDALLSRYQSSDILKVHYFRRGRLFCADLVLEKKPKDVCTLTIAKDVSEKTKDLRQKWFSGN